MDTSHVTNMRATFAYDSSLTNLDELKNWDTSNVTNMQTTFLKNLSLTNIDGLKNWDISSVTEMLATFSNNIGMTNLNALESWNTSKVINMSFTFHNCNHLEDTLGIKDWDVSNVETMSHMFNISDDIGEYNYSKLANLDISKWNMPKVKEYDWFIDSLRYVESEFTIRNSNIEKYEGMFNNTADLSGRVVVNYTSETESMVDQLIATAPYNANVIKGRLVE